MTQRNLTDLHEVCNQVATQTGDAMRQIMQAFVQQLMGAEVDQRCGAPAGAREEERTNRRNGYRERRWDTRMGTVDLQVPRLRRGTYFPDWLLQRRRRAEQVLEQVVAESFVLGVSTRRVDGLVKALGIDGIPDSAAVHQLLDRVVSQLKRSGFERAAEALEAYKEKLLAFTSFPKCHWRQVWSKYPQND